uniref:NolW domain protein n=1 Tax=Solibacter usitatus (strain Ellin6076) TaxID=234267 RepID=Q024H2_SOLUE
MAVRLILPALFAAALSAQSIDRTFYFTHGESPQNLQEIVNIVRGVGIISQVTSQPAKDSVTVTGTAEQIALADWLCHQLSQPGDGQQPQEYRVPGSDLPVVHVYFLANVITPQDLQEVTNATRSITDIQRAFPYAHLQALALRGTADQIGAADWMVRELNQAGPGQNSQEFPLPLAAPRKEVAKVFYVKNTLTLQGIQEMVNMTRSIADIQRFFPYNARHAIVARGSAEQIALASWLVQLLDQSLMDRPTGQPVNEYRVTGDRNPIVSLVYLADNQPPQSVQEIVSTVRTATEMQRIFGSPFCHAVAMRGTADQVARAGELIKTLTR